MRTYEFNVIVSPLDDATADAIYGMCPDSSVGANHGIDYVAFDREADSLEDAIRSAVAQLRALAVRPLRIEMDTPDALAS